VYPILAEATDPTRLPTATPGELAEAVVRCVDAGACVINLSVALDRPTSREERDLEQALDYAARGAVITVAAAGNQSTIGSSPITRHPWVIPVVACDRRGLPVAQSNLGRSIGARGLCAPGDRIPALGTGSGAVTFGGTSAAAPFVTGAIALLRSVFPRATATAVLLAVAPRTRRRAVVPPLMNAWSAYRTLESTIGGEVA
jgi:subtilisin family serine protease